MYCSHGSERMARPGQCKERGDVRDQNQPSSHSMDGTPGTPGTPPRPDSPPDRHRESCRTGLPTQDEVSRLRSVYRKHVGVGETDHVVVACNHLLFKHAGFGWLDARHLVRSGPDGADMELLEVIHHEHVAERFAHVTIASGDGIFAEAAANLAARGCRVTVVSRRESLSARLALAAHEVIYLDPVEPMTIALAA